MSDDNDDLDEQFDHESFKPSCSPSSESIIGGYAVARTAEQKTSPGKEKEAEACERAEKCERNNDYGIVTSRDEAIQETS